ncbi:MAG TPA: monovalent cation:proton antiporter-2 (CPA2) family protein [Steroidobacteraceae bacterium]|nr:monovalent cation:proton antiporter-2 (CPA2) family protein [Steroidobacteraceae bacterium]
MPTSTLSQLLLLLSAAVLVVALARRLGLPATLGYLLVGMVLGPRALGMFADSPATHALGEIGVVFLLFALGLEFSWPRMLAMRREVFGLGLLQLVAVGACTAALALAAGIGAAPAVVLGGAIAMSSTAIVLQQLTDQAELNRTHGRLAFAVLLFQDLAFVPLLTLATALAEGGAAPGAGPLLRLVAGGLVALLVVYALGRWLLRPLFHEIAHSRLRELFTLTALLVVLASAWITQAVGLSMALGAFLGGMMLSESEYRHQVEAAIRPFRELLLGLFFVSVGMLLDLRLLLQEFGLISLLLAGLLLLKMLLGAASVRPFVASNFRAVRTAIVVAGGGEFGVALLTILLQRSGLVPPQQAQPLLAALVLSMLISPLLIRYNRAIARALLGERGPPATALEREEAAAIDVARREHVILCGYGRVGQNIARVLESQGFEYLAIDLDPARIRLARQAGEPVVFGDSADEELLRQVGLDTASAVIISFADPSVSVGIVRAVRRLRADVPLLVRTQDDTRLAELTAAGATEVVPETFEASLMLVSQVLMLLHVPVSKVVRTVADIRAGRYRTLRTIFRHEGARPIDERHAFREELRTIVLPRGAWAVGRQIAALRARGAEVAFTAVRRHGITGREPDDGTELREGDVVVIYGTPEALEHAEAVLLAG